LRDNLTILNKNKDKKVIKKIYYDSTL